MTPDGPTERRKASRPAVHCGKLCAKSSLLLLAFVTHGAAGTERASVQTNAESSLGAPKQFIACPIYRDTDAGPKSGCWLAPDRETGERFDVTGALSKPQLGRAILVEGRTASGDEEQCGAKILEPVRVSVLEQSCPEHIIPAENFSGRRFALPKEVMQPTSVERTLPLAPYQNTTFTILFNFGSNFLNYQYSEIILEKAALYIKASQPARVEVIGFAATEDYEVSGQHLNETLDLAEARARQVALALSRLAPNSRPADISWQGKPQPVEHYAGGLAEETRRRVEIRIHVE